MHTIYIARDGNDRRRAFGSLAAADLWLAVSRPAGVSGAAWGEVHVSRGVRTAAQRNKELQREAAAHGS